MSTNTYVPIPNDGTTRKVQNRQRTVGADNVVSQVIQQAKDVDRVNIMWTVSKVAAAAAAEAMLTITESRDGAATTTFSSKVVTTDKILRITSIQIAIEADGTTPDLCRNNLRLRFNAAGAVTTSSPVQAIWRLASSTIEKDIVHLEATFPEGIEFLGDGTKEIGLSWEAEDYVVTVNVPILSMTLFGFEYQA